MKKGQAEYSEHYIKYWPKYEGGKLFLTYLYLTELLFMVTSIYSLLDGAVLWKIIINIVISLFSFWLLHGVAINTMSCVIRVSHKGVEFNNEKTHKRIFVFWENVDVVYCYQEFYRGRRSLRVYLKKNSNKYQYKNKYDILIPITNIDTEKLASFIPNTITIKGRFCD